MNGKVLSSLGMCRRAGKLICGTPMICKALRDSAGRVELVASARDVSEGTYKKLSDKCKYYTTPLVRIDCTCEELAAAVGKSGQLAAVAVTDKNLAALVEKNLTNDQSKAAE